MNFFDLLGSMFRKRQSHTYGGQRKFNSKSLLFANVRKCQSKLARKMIRQYLASPYYRMRHWSAGRGGIKGAFVGISFTSKTYANYRRNRKKRRLNPNIRQIKNGRITKQWATA